ncbi:MAG TPA: patatin-like phospholipase family protein [Thermoflexales bacterium]|mgnify:CR=1 FL=1|nr:patatin-like phospholipase family protein [Thermoflexales bacterium]HQX74995.1 patatin-like phospholipase family protein [Thermoflexales bacterium]HQZ21034.1 patatin-like phospholipase family protein [Thermoflexales bacterium]HQZ98601.1 patatin-like phospholipase family protein [Thermoflexales bacterium]
MKRILSIDGGGIRGIIPLCALVELEKQTGKLTRDVFNMVAGTSTGAIIAAAVGIGMTAQKTLDLYQTLGSRIFKTDWLAFITTLGGMKYHSTACAAVYREFIGDVTINELPIDLMLTMMRVVDGKPFYAVKDNPANAGTTGKLKVVDCVTASAAAPTFFDPYDVPTIGRCVDGGTGIAGNPVYQACVEAFYYTGGAYTPEDSVVVSLGTGIYDGAANPVTFIDWARWVMLSLLESPAEQQTELVQRHFATLGTYRLNPPLPRDIGLDNLSAIPDLVKIGTAAAAQIDWKTILLGKSSTQRSLPKPKLQRNIP